MNNKMAIHTYISTIKSKKQTKQTRRTETKSWIQRAFWWLPDWGGNGWRGEGIKYKYVLQNSRGDVKYSIGNGVAKELICMTNGH